jgi:hypothetical protein
MFDMTQDELIALNPDLINELKWMLLRIPSRIPAALADEYKSLSKKITWIRKRMALLLPFNIATI